MIIDWGQVQGYISGVGLIINYSVTIPIPIPRGGGQKKSKRKFDIIKDDNEVILLVAQAFTRIMQ